MLAAWVLVVEGLVVRFLDSSPTTWIEPGEGPWPFMLWVTGFAFVFVVFTRGSRDSSIDQAVMRRVLMTLPFYWALSLIGMGVSWIRGGERSSRHFGGDEAEWPFPSVPDWLRRMVATPILLVGDSAFLASFRTEQGHFLSLGETPAWTDYGSVFFVIALPYLLFVVGPRIAAGASGDGRIWVLRFAVYCAALVAGYQLQDPTGI